MRRAICPQPLKRFDFVDTNEEIYKKLIYFLKKT